MRECEHLLYTDPSTLLFSELGSGPAIARQTWRIEMQAALGASQTDRNHDHDASTPALEVPVDTEGSIRFRRRRRKSSRKLS